jgi:hypothetical protein
MACWIMRAAERAAVALRVGLDIGGLMGADVVSAQLFPDPMTPG